MSTLFVDVNVDLKDISEGKEFIEAAINKIELNSNPADLMLIALCTISTIRKDLKKIFPEIIVDLLLTQISTGQISLNDFKENNQVREFLENCLEKEVDNG